MKVKQGLGIKPQMASEQGDLRILDLVQRCNSQNSPQAVR